MRLDAPQGALPGCAGSLAWLAGSQSSAPIGLSRRDHQDDACLSGRRDHDLLAPADRGGADSSRTALMNRVVENKPGDGPMLGAPIRSRTPNPTLHVARRPRHARSSTRTIYKKLPLRPGEGLAPIGLVAGVPFALVINPQSRHEEAGPNLLPTPNRNPGLAYG